MNAESKARSSPRLFLLVVLSGLLFLLALLLAAVVVWPKLALDRDTQGLQTLVQRALPPGATLARAESVLRSGDVLHFLSAHGYNDPVEDVPFQRVPSYDATRFNSQLYPDGRMLAVNMSYSWDKGIELYFFFDRQGRLLRCSAKGYDQFLLG